MKSPNYSQEIEKNLNKISEIPERMQEARRQKEYVFSSLSGSCGGEKQTKKQMSSFQALTSYVTCQNEKKNNKANENKKRQAPLKGTSNLHSHFLLLTQKSLSESC